MVAIVYKDCGAMDENLWDLHGRHSQLRVCFGPRTISLREILGPQVYLRIVLFTEVCRIIDVCEVEWWFVDVLAYKLSTGAPELL